MKLHRIMQCLALSSFAYAPATPMMHASSVRASSPAMAEKSWPIGVWDAFETRSASLMPDATAPFTGEVKDAAGLEALANDLNPIVGYFDPLNIGAESAETIAWFRHAEIKHGRVAMAAFVGYIVQANGIHFPWDIANGFVGPVMEGAYGFGDGSSISFGDISAAGSPPAQWDALPTAAKTQIITAIGFLEMWGESSVALGRAGEKHYVRGGKPGFYPPFKAGKETIAAPHPVPLNLWDPFGFTKKMTEEKKATALLAEVNNGRLAMIGIMGVLSASKGAIVPGLDSLAIPAYDGEIMAPFAASDATLPFVTKMLSIDVSPWF